MSWLENNNKWNEDSSDEEYDEQNEADIPPIDPKFIEILQEIKHILYDLLIFGSPENTPDAQNDTLREEYKRRLHRLYQFTKNGKNDRKVGLIIINHLTQFPKNIQEENQDNINLLRTSLHSFLDDWIYTNYKNVRSEDLPQYTDYIRNKLYEYPYDQSDKIREEIEE